MSKLYIVFDNNASGSMWIESVEEYTDWTYQQLGGSHATNIFESESREECEKYIDECIAESGRYEIFYTNDYYYYHYIDCTTGTYQDNGLDWSDMVAETKTEEEAQEYCNKYNTEEVGNY